MTELDYRTKCLRQQINACVGCGQRKDLVVHHINGDRSDNRLENLIPVCKSCHAKIHNGDEISPHLQQYQDQLPEDKKEWQKRGSPSETTTITVSPETWRYLNMKKKPGESFNDVLTRLLNIDGGGSDE